MKRTFTLFFTSLLIGIATIAQDYGAQIPNSDFEADWVKYSGNKKSGKEPYRWHSFMSGNGMTGTIALGIKDQLANRTDVRPGSKGTHSVSLFSTKTLGIIANGSLTNGRMNCGSTTATANSNHIYTDRGNEDFNTPISVVPDSITVWLCFYTTNDSNEAAFHAAIHGDENFILYGNGKESNQEMQVADALLEYTRTTTDKNTLRWERKSIPFVAKGTCTTPKYILVSLSTNKTPAKGSSDDYVLVDDIVLIYNPTLETGVLATTEFEAEATEAINVDVPFNLTGSMSVSNLNKAANQVIAQLSDENGSFDNPTEIGRVTTNTSGVVSAQIPASVGSGKYKVRVVSTNYPMTAAPSTSEITIKRYYQVAFSEYDNTLYTLSGDGRYFLDGNLNVTLSAVSKSEEYSFLYWIEDGTVLSTSAEYSFTINKSHTIQAKFGKMYNVTVTATAGGSVSSEGGMFGEGIGQTFSAPPDEGYKFINWTVDGAEVSTNPTYSFVVDGNKELVANFAPYIVVSATPNIEEAGAISGSGEYILTGESVEVTLTAVVGNEDDFYFSHWAEGEIVLSESKTYTFEASESRTLMAVFYPRVHIAISANNEGGSVAGAGAYLFQQKTTLVATPNEGYRFAGWMEADTVFSPNAIIEFMAESNREFVAKFIKQNTLEIESNLAGAGTIAGAGTYDENAGVEISATPNEGFVFVNWTMQGEEISKDLTATIIMDEEKAVVANFAAIPQYTIAVNIEPVSGGTVSGNGTYYENTTVTLTAMPNNGYNFVKWMENGADFSTEPSLTFEATEDRSFQAYFEANFIGHTISLSATQGGTVEGAGLFEEGDEVTITATANEKYQFQSWTNEDDEVVSTDEKYSFIITEDVILTANFERVYENFAISVASADEAAGTVEGAGTYKEENQVTVTAVAADGYRFLHWAEGETVVSTNAEYSFVCSKASNLTAVFMKTYEVTIEDFVGGTIKGLGNGVFDEGTQVNLIIAVDENYRFQSWNDAEDNSVLSTSTVYSFIVEKDMALAVVVKEKGKMCTLSVQTGGTVAGLRNGQYEEGETVTLIATPSEGYVFNGWVSNGEIVCKEPLYTFEISDNISLYAEFVPKAKSVEVTVSINDEAFGSAIGAGTYTAGDEVQLIATPAVGYEFVGWTKNGKPLSNLTTLYYTIVEDCIIEAEFKFIEKGEISAVEDVEVLVAVYPNPATTEVSVTADASIDVVRVYALSGKVLLQEKVDDYSTTIDVRNLKRGIYIVIIECGGNRIQKEIVVK